MTSVPSLTGKEILSALKKAGFEILRIKGSHHFLHHPDGRSTVAGSGNSFSLMDAQDRIRETKLNQLRQDIQEGLDSARLPFGILTRLSRKAAKDRRPRNTIRHEG